ncbi:MAG: ribosome-associated translation inhibitor RaiA [Bacteroidia bacterium]|jgi:putative sigma-54 modulation protein|nr:ribosome-associated translation inhibitor RaiA [Bacteroidia bacterium]MCF8425228.1 ribosome-associated translation inhibitor RaiA [Bacteroidia bacterium]MCF8446448.1 ribosome-associated translation inhibitor RaiA [Bacteroidia bacterium]
MKIEIQSIHFKADVKLLDFIKKKIEKTQTFFDGAQLADVYLRLEKDKEKENKVVEIKMNVAGYPIFAKEQSATFETATDLVLDKLVAQIRKQKEKIQAKTA